MDAKRSQKILGDVLDLSRRAGLPQEAEVEVSLSSGREANTRFAKSEITTTGDVEEATVSVRVALGQRHSRATTNQTDPASLRAAVESAYRMARRAPQDPEHMPVLGPQRYPGAASAFDATTERLDAGVRAEAARTAITAGDRDGLEVSGFYAHGTSARALASSAGLSAYYSLTNAEFTLTARTKDGTGSGWAGATSHRAGDIDAAALSRVAIDKAVRSAKPRRLEPGRYTVVLEPAAVGELLQFLLSSMDARRADEGRSFFSRPGGEGTRLGDKLFPETITLRSDPSDQQTPGAPFDAEGLPLRPLTWIDKGTIHALLYSRFWAQKQGKQPTGRPEVTHLLGGAATPEQLLAGVKKGVLVTHFFYTRYVDPQSILITGLTRDGVFLIEDGQLTAPVNNFRFNESPVTMLKNADAMTRTTVLLPGLPSDMSLRVPALRTHEFNLASISDAV